MDGDSTSILQAIIAVNKPHHCPYCGEAFGNSDAIEAHLQLCTGAMPYSCQQCGGMFADANDLDVHMQTCSNGEKQHKCIICAKTFSSITNLSRHCSRVHGSKIGQQKQQQHSGVKLCFCKQCDKYFKQKQSYLEHSETHNVLICGICKIEFQDFSVWKDHMKNHAATPNGGHSRVEKCAICSKEFTSLYYLRKHMHIHADTKQHLCPHCGDQFRTAVSLLHHKKRIHPHNPEAVSMRPVW